MRAEFCSGSEPHLLEALLDCLTELGLLEGGDLPRDDTFTKPGKQL